MSNVLVVAEHVNGQLRSVSLAAVTFARQAAALTGGQVIGLVLGSGAEAVAQEFATSGVDRLLVEDNPAFANYLAENYGPAVASVAKSNDVSVVHVRQRPDATGRGTPRRRYGQRRDRCLG